MAFVAIVLFVILCLAFLPTSLYPKLRRSVARRAVSRNDNCVEPPHYLHQDLKLGHDLIDLTKQAFKENRYLEFTQDLHSQYGRTFKTIYEGKVILKTSDPEISKAVYATHFENFGMQPIRYEGGKGFFGDGIVVTDGAQWKRSRTLLVPIFKIAHIVNFDRLHRHVGIFMDLLPQDGSTINLMHLLKRLTLDLSSEFIFGKAMGALASPESCKGFIDAFLNAQRGVPVSSLRDKKWQESCDMVTKYIDDRVEEAIQRVSSKESVADDTVTDKHIRLIDELARETQDRLELRYLALGVFNPSHDTVAAVLGNLFFHLARHPHVWRKLREEILPTSNQPLTYTLLNSYKYLNWSLRETHRLTPIVPSTIRECLQTCILPVGGGPDGKSPLLVEEGTWIETNFRLAQRDKAFWGEDAEVFRPERWETVRPTWEFTPFLGGPRICPALKLVYTECQYIAVAILRKFEGLENRDPVVEWVEERRLLYRSKNGAVVGLIP